MTWRYLDLPNPASWPLNEQRPTPASVGACGGFALASGFIWNSPQVLVSISSRDLDLIPDLSARSGGNHSCPTTKNTRRSHHPAPRHLTSHAPCCCTCPSAGCCTLLPVSPSCVNPLLALDQSPPAIEAPPERHLRERARIPHWTPWDSTRVRVFSPPASG